MDDVDAIVVASNITWPSLLWFLLNDASIGKKPTTRQKLKTK